MAEEVSDAVQEMGRAAGIVEPDELDALSDDLVPVILRAIVEHGGSLR